MKDDYTFATLFITTVVLLISIVMLAYDETIVAGAFLLGLSINVIIDCGLFRIWHYPFHPRSAYRKTKTKFEISAGVKKADLGQIKEANLDEAEYIKRTKKKEKSGWK